MGGRGHPPDVGEPRGNISLREVRGGWAVGVVTRASSRAPLYSLTCLPSAILSGTLSVTLTARRADRAASGTWPDTYVIVDTSARTYYSLPAPYLNLPAFQEPAWVGITKNPALYGPTAVTPVSPPRILH